MSLYYSNLNSTPSTPEYPHFTALYRATETPTPGTKCYSPRRRPNVKTVQSILRHADISTTLDIYTHAMNNDKLVAQNQVPLSASERQSGWVHDVAVGQEAPTRSF